MPHALLVDDDTETLLGLAKLVERQGFTTSAVATLRDARQKVATEAFDAVLVDLVLPDGSGLDLLKDLEENGSRAEIVLITGHASVDTAVEALRMGVADYLTKPVDTARLKSVLATVARTRELKQEIGSLREELRQLGHFGQLLGASPAMQKIYDGIARVAPTEATVLLTGESGAGKDVVAQTIHQLSRRRSKPFLPVNCGAISPSLIESELFGHERGSFTGADRTHKGHFERAHGGTLFLDEITEMPIELQVKLLRVLETGAVYRIGGERPVEVDVRIIAATNRLPEEAVEKGKLREDLLYRLKVFPLELPPLRERGDDIVLLAEHFLSAQNKAEGTSKRFNRSAIERLRCCSWPGNVRELKNVVHRAYIMADDEIGVDALPQEAAPAAITTNGSPTNSVQVRVGSSLAEAERRLILATLELFEKDKKRTAEVLGISLKTLYNRLNAYNLQ